MIEVTAETHFAAAHRLRDYEGACERLHGHNYRVAATLRGRQTGPAGMLVDFKILRRALEDVTGRLDHVCLNDDVAEFAEGRLNPTAENIAGWIAERLASRLAGAVPPGAGRRPGAELARVTVWESEKSSASWSRD